MGELAVTIRTDTEHANRCTLVQGGPPITVGRNPRVDVAVADQRVSWVHARIWLNEQGAWLRDLGSSNGTTLDGREVKGTVALGVGSVICVAGVLWLEIGLPDEVTESRKEFWFLDDLETGLRHRVEGSLDIEGPPTVTLTRKGDVWWILGAGVAVPVEPGFPFAVCGRQLVLNSTDQEEMATAIGELHPGQ